ncbi:MAG TPA: hypothetical protein VLX44_03255 [Xanthobacteraceae bacterium]|nr:hypothetical protein [Xanthobacteraceae bacterium]
MAARRELASADDVRQILGALDPDKVLDIIALQPTIRDLEDVSTFLSGDADVFGAGNPLQSPAGDIVAILTADEEDEEGA